MDVSWVTYIESGMLTLRPSEEYILTHTLSPESKRCPGPQLGLLGMFNASASD